MSLLLLVHMLMVQLDMQTHRVISSPACLAGSCPGHKQQHTLCMWTQTQHHPWRSYTPRASPDNRQHSVCQTTQTRTLQQQAQMMYTTHVNTRSALRHCRLAISGSMPSFCGATLGPQCLHAPEVSTGVDPAIAYLSLSACAACLANRDQGSCR
jgi:hypothetical protein